MGNSSSTSSTISRSVRAFTSLLDSGDDGSMGAQNRDDATPSGAAMEDDPHVTPKVASARVAVGVDQDFSFITKENGMFSLLGFESAHIQALKKNYSIYMERMD